MASNHFHCEHCGKKRWGKLSSDGQTFMCYAKGHVNGLVGTLALAAKKIFNK